MRGGARAGGALRGSLSASQAFTMSLNSSRTIVFTSCRPTISSSSKKAADCAGLGFAPMQSSAVSSCMSRGVGGAGPPLRRLSRCHVRSRAVCRFMMGPVSMLITSPALPKPLTPAPRATRRPTTSASSGFTSQLQPGAAGSSRSRCSRMIASSGAV